MFEEASTSVYENNLKLNQLKDLELAPETLKPNYRREKAGHYQKQDIVFMVKNMPKNSDTPKIKKQKKKELEHHFNRPWKNIYQKYRTLLMENKLLRLTKERNTLEEYLSDISSD